MNDITINLLSACSSAIITSFFVHPIEVIKIRLQIDNKRINSKTLVHQMYKQEGILSYWKGIKPAILREGSYTTLRIGLYSPIKDYFRVTSESPTYLKFFSGSLAGLIAVSISNPFDILKTRTMASTKDIKLLNLIKSIHATGFQSFYSNLPVNLTRGMILNGVVMSSNDTIKKELVKLNFTTNVILLNAISGFGSGFIVTCVVNPFDVIRTRLMNQNLIAPQYKGIVDCARQMVKKEGIKSMYYGFIPLWFKFAPTTVLHFVFFEQIKNFLKQKI